MSLQSLCSERKSRKYKPRDVTRGTRPKGKWREIMTFFFSPTTIPWLHHSVDFWGVRLRLHLLMIFFVNDNFFSKYLKIDMTSLRLHSGYPLKETKWRLVQEIDQEIDTALGWSTYKSIFLVKTALLVVVRITYPWPVGKNKKDTDLYPKISGGVLACLQDQIKRGVTNR